jgi:hypothetical protein
MATTLGIEVWEAGVATTVGICVGSGAVVVAGASGDEEGCSASRAQPPTIMAIKIAPIHPDLRFRDFRIRTSDPPCVGGETADQRDV